MTHSTPRIRLHNLLTELQTQLGETPYVYYDPPETVKMTYPCFVYTFSNVDQLYSGDMVYLSSQVYTVKYITRQADPKMFWSLVNIPYASFVNSYTADNLHHFIFDFRGQYERLAPEVEADDARF